MNERSVKSGAFTLILLLSACGSDRTEKNPSFNTGSGGSRSKDAGAGTSVPGSGGSQSDAGSGSSGAPPYDCVLNPNTHAEIINACTDAIRIEKHPELPPTPMQ